MYWVMRAWPTSPSLASFSSEGTATCNSCRMIEAVMYGMMPSAKIAMRDSPPPENRFSKPRMFEPPNCFWMLLTAVRFTPGTGTWEPNR